LYNLRNPKQRARYRRATFKRRDSNFGAAERIIRAVFARERKVMINALPRVGKVDKAEWTKAFKQIWILAGGDAWKYSEETWGGARRLKPQKSINPLLLHTFNYQFIQTKQAPTAWLTYVADYIDTKGGDKIDDIGATTKDKLQHAIFAGVEQEEGIPDIAKRVADVYDGFEGYRATMIARSEVVDASNQASLAQAREAGSTLDLMWVATNDDRTREEHAEMDGVTVAYDQEFDCADGTTMPGEAVNCRCTIGYAIPSEPVAEAAAEGGEVFTDYNDAISAFEKYGGSVSEYDKQLVADYTQSAYNTLNSYLYGSLDMSDMSAENIALLKNDVNRLHEIIQNAPQFKGIVYRGIGTNREAILRAAVGDELNFSGFTSTSISEKTATGMAQMMATRDQSLVLYEIQGANGAPIEKLAAEGYGSLQEVLINNGANVQVVSRGYETITTSDLYGHTSELDILRLVVKMV